MLEFTSSWTQKKKNILEYTGFENLTSVADPDCDFLASDPDPDCDYWFF